MGLKYEPASKPLHVSDLTRRKDESERFRGGLVFKAHRLLYHSTLDSRVIKRKKKKT
jgi:hypothetical protein